MAHLSMVRLSMVRLARGRATAGFCGFLRVSHIWPPAGCGRRAGRLSRTQWRDRGGSRGGPRLRL